MTKEQRDKASKLCNPNSKYYIGEEAVKALKSGEIALSDFPDPPINKKRSRRRRSKMRLEDTWNIANDATDKYIDTGDFHTYGYPDEYWQD